MQFSDVKISVKFKQYTCKNYYGYIEYWYNIKKNKIYIDYIVFNILDIIVKFLDINITKMR